MEQTNSAGIFSQKKHSDISIPPLTARSLNQKGPTLEQIVFTDLKQDIYEFERNLIIDITRSQKRKKKSYSNFNKATKMCSSLFNKYCSYLTATIKENKFTTTWRPKTSFGFIFRQFTRSYSF